ncbi:O-antigen ligase family protein [Clostridium perfringens]|uniref:O-antigen ligase family protein n=1 Tax=Clostridium perfringens TaxID=1502 RepID=UPI001ABB2137|nr:O-antigen ligase family protein [Clostridium perfringens]MBO3395351.1 O-antigen ligase family protein [Clostridium perfringens]MBO3401851.1 O-antigen ligase family protein [Clostridium perfringens]MDM0963117.1 O-antigen ligase family protein [Clostridium perfringens]
MNFGLIAMLPTFIGLHMYRNLFNINKFLCIELISFIELVIFANKGAIISAILFIAIVKIINFKYIRYKLIKIISYIFIVLLILLNLEKILIMLQSLAIKYGFSSYSLNTLLAYLEIGNNISLNSRVELWENAYKMFCEKPILGNGVGSYQSNFGIYTHNIFLDVLVFYGFIGFFILFYFIFKSLKKINTSDIYFKYFGYITFTLWFPTLLLSSNFYVNYYFWIFIILGFRKRIVN